MTKAPLHIAFASIVLIVATMAFAYRWSALTFDWLGYRLIYERGGAWLSRDGRDPGFVLLVESAFAVFGNGGYERFRLVLGGAFLAFASWLAFIAPRQRIGIWQIAVVAAIVLAAFLLKASIQIREGIAFGLVVLSLLALHRGKNFAWTFAPLLAALSIHIGMMVFLAALAATYSLVIVLETSFGERAGEVVESRGFVRILLLVGVALGTGVAIAVANFSGLAYALSDFGAYQRAISDTSDLAKTAYWIINGGMIFLLRQRLLGTLATRMPRPAFAFTHVLASMLLPGCYALAVILLLTGQPPVVVAFAGRMLATLIHLGLIIIMLRGRADYGTLIVALWMLADAVRLYSGALVE